MWQNPMMGGCGYGGGGGCGMGMMPPMMGACGYGGGGGCAMGGGMGGGNAAAGMYSSPEEETLYNEIATALQPFLHLEKEWDADKFRKKMIEYFNKAHKGVSFGPNTWEKNVDDYCIKFYECYWRALGDRYSYVEKVDLATSMAAAIRYYYTPAKLPQGLPEEEFRDKVNRANNYAFDIARWQSWGYQIVKQNVTGKQSQKKVSEAIEYGREECVRQLSVGAIADNETFLQQFVEKTMAKLSSISGGDTNSVLPMQTAVKLWNALIQEGGGIPISLERQNGRPPAGWDEIDKAVRAAYSSPGMAASASMGGASAGGGMGGMGGMGAGMGMMGYGMQGFAMPGYAMPGYAPY